MSDIVRFTNNYSDHSNDTGYQFEFFCERCGNGYKSGFDSSGLRMGSKLARGLGGLLGGLGGAADVADSLSDMTNSQAKDKALRKAVGEIAPLFNQCHGCGNWVCKEICWNDESQQCVNCAPKVEQSIATMQSQARRDQLQQKITETNYTEGFNVERTQVALCPHCGAEAVAGAKFCGDCGKQMTPTGMCGKCGTQAPAGTKFCPECGTKL